MWTRERNDVSLMAQPSPRWRTSDGDDPSPASLSRTARVNRLVERPALLDEADAAVGKEATKGYGNAAGSGRFPEPLRMAIVDLLGQDGGAELLGLALLLDQARDQFAQRRPPVRLGIVLRRKKGHALADLLARGVRCRLAALV